MVAQAMREGNEETKKSALTIVLWLALKHPHESSTLRRGMSQVLRQAGKAHLSVTVDVRRTWAFTMAKRFVDLSPGTCSTWGEDGVTL